MSSDVMNESLGLANACFELARVLKWSMEDSTTESEIGG